MKALTYIEIDVPDFADSSPEIEQTFRFSVPDDYLPADIDAIPSVTAVSYTPAVISLGQDLGQRATLKISFKDHRHIFAAEAFDSGTFWGKWRARYGTRLRGRNLRWISGLLGQSLAEMETRHFIIESTDGPTPQGVYTLTAKDVLKQTDGDRAQAPRPSNGFIVGAISDSDTAATLSPSGIGNFEYPASGYVAIGGEEICAFTRSGDSLTLTRGQLETVAVEHDAGSRVQLCLQYTGEDPADIIADLLETYAGVPAEYIPLTSWLLETGTYLQQNYSATIAEPTSVNKLVSELIEQAALALWWDPLTQRIRLQVLRAIPTTAETFSEENTIESTLATKEQPNMRVSQVFTYFGQRNPLEQLDEPKNFRSAALTIDGDAEAAYGAPVIKKIYSRWIPFGARTVALRLNDLILGRFRDPPRNFRFSAARYGDIEPMLGGGYQVEAWPLQTITGEVDAAPVQVTRINPLSDRFEIEAEEMLFAQLDPGDLVNRTIIIDADINNVNLRSLHDSIYPPPDVDASPAESLTCIIGESVVIGASNTSTPAFQVGDWPSGYPITLQVYGRIQGAGGRGGDGSKADPQTAPQNGLPGGTALYSRFAVDVDIMSGGAIYGGGGGGGGCGTNDGESFFDRLGGGGGAGRIAGVGGGGSEAGTFDPAQNGGLDEGGAGGQDSVAFFPGGDGGDPGEAGQAGKDGGTGGAAGNAIDGVSFVTLSDSSPTGVRGPTVN